MVNKVRATNQQSISRAIAIGGYGEKGIHKKGYTYREQESREGKRGERSNRGQRRVGLV
jgi:hypothetical protein